MVEEIPTHLYPGLVSLSVSVLCHSILASLRLSCRRSPPRSDGKEVMQKLVTWTLQCLSMDHIGELPIMVGNTLCNAVLCMAFELVIGWQFSNDHNFCCG